MTVFEAAVTHEVVRAPKWPAAAAAGTAILAAVGGVVCQFVAENDDIVVVALAGYILGCIATVILASTHRALENRQRSNPGFRLEPWLGHLAQVAMIVGFAGGLWCAFSLATEWAKA